MSTSPYLDAACWTRRDFLRLGAMAGAALAGPALAMPTPRKSARAVIQICLLGGPSQLDTWDPRPDAPAEIRGPYRSIPTSVPGIRLAETLPRLARMADRFALLRTLHHQEAPIHETGLQLTQTGRLFAGGVEWPHFGEMLSARTLADRHPRSWLIVPAALAPGCAGLALGSGQRASLALEFGREEIAHLGVRILPSVHERYGRHTLGQALLTASFLVRFGGFRLVTVNMFDTVFGQTTWDCHANGSDLNSTLADYGRTLCPMLDQALSALLEDLDQTGWLDETLVVCLGELGRTPRINAGGGRDHWTRCWSGLMAGGGVQGGRVIGRSDAHAAEPTDRPIHAAEVVATVGHAFGIDSMVEAAPIHELF